MTSDRKAASNRRNARKSTGPKTPEGMATVRLNALKHGLLSQEVLLPDEDHEVLQELGERLRDELQPVGELENLLVDRIIAAYWRLRRLGRVEAGIFAWERSGALAEQAESEARTYEGQWDPELLMELANYAGDTVTDEDKHKEALARTRQYRDEQKAETATLGRTFSRDADKANAFSKLSRYETTIERGLFKALHELERRQASARVRMSRHRWPWMSMSRGSPRAIYKSVWLCFVISFLGFSPVQELSTERAPWGARAGSATRLRVAFTELTQ